MENLQNGRSIDEWGPIEHVSGGGIRPVDRDTIDDGAGDGFAFVDFVQKLERGDEFLARIFDWPGLRHCLPRTEYDRRLLDAVKFRRVAETRYRESATRAPAASDDREAVPPAAACPLADMLTSRAGTASPWDSDIPAALIETVAERPADPLDSAKPPADNGTSA